MALCAVLGETEAGMVLIALVIGTVAGVAIRGEPGKRNPCVTLDAVQSGMTAGKREEIVPDIGTGPTNGDMTLLTISCPATGRMVRAGGTSEIVSMAKVALGRCSPELAGTGPRMTAFTGGDGMTTDEGKTRARMLDDEPDRLPVVLVMATFTSQAHGRGMRVRVTTTAASGQINRHRTTIVMTT